MKLLSFIAIASISSVLVALPSAAQYNGSNQSGANVNSSNGSSRSIWDSNRKEAPVQRLIPPVTYERPTEIVPATVTIVEKRSCPPILKGTNTIVNYNTAFGCPQVTIVKTRTYPISPAPRGRG